MSKAIYEQMLSNREKELQAERRRAQRAEALVFSLRNAMQSMLKEIELYSNPETCSRKMSHYGTCKLGTHGCSERHGE